MGQYRVLSDEDVDNFMRHGFVHLKNTFTQDKAKEWMSDMWTRLGLSPDTTHWPIERCNMATHRAEDVKDFAPKVWGAMCDLLGGPDKIRGGGSSWGDGLIINLGDVDGSTEWLSPQELDGWHVDGDFFTHFLDSPEQALLVVPMFTDVEKEQGPTIAAADSIAHIAQYLYDHPEGVTPRMTPKRSNRKDDMTFFKDISLQCSDFTHVTGKVGDCYLLHPLTMHTASRNVARKPRVILNPAVGLEQAFNLDREDPKDYSLVERKTLMALGKPDGLKGWKVTGPREHVIPARIKLQAGLKALETKRLNGENVEGIIDNGLGGRRLEEVNKLEGE